jgi:hypothetical protein
MKKYNLLENLALNKFLKSYEICLCCKAIPGVLKRISWRDCRELNLWRNTFEEESIKLADNHFENKTKKALNCIFLNSLFCELSLISLSSKQNYNLNSNHINKTYQCCFKKLEERITRKTVQLIICVTCYDLHNIQSKIWLF